jgi:choline dehydrogenase-like flavoprotein
MRIQFSYTPNNVESFNRLKDRWVDVLKKAGHASTSLPLHAYFKKRIPIEGVGHQNGTCRMGTDLLSSISRESLPYRDRQCDSGS